MLPLLAQLDPSALATGPPVKRSRLEDGEAAPEPAAPDLHLLGLPPEVLAMIFRQLDADPGVPMLLVRRVKHVFQVDISEFVPEKEDVFYMRLPDPKAGALNADRFYEDGYESPAILEGVVDMAGFDADTTMTQFLRVEDKHGIPDKLVDKDVYVEGDYYTIFEYARDAMYDIKDPADERTWRNTRGERLVLGSWPTFKAYVAIVLLLDEYV